MPTRATLAEGDVRTHLVRLTIPMIWGLLAMMALNVTDTWFVAQLGARELAAMSFTFPVVMVLISLGIGLMAGTSSVLARAIGENDNARARRLATDALVLSTAVSVVFAAIGLLTLEPLFRLLGAEASLVPLIADYMVTWYVGLPLVIVPMAGMGIIRATGDSRFQGRVMGLAALVNVVLDPLLIFGLAGLPRLELTGAALATLIARAITLWLCVDALRRRDLLDLRMPSAAALARSWRAILHVGLPAAGTNAIIPAATGVAVALLARYGEHAVAGFGTASRIEGLSLIVFYAMSSIIGPFAGQNLGAGRPDRVREAIRLSAGFCLGLGAVLALLLGLAARPLMALFTTDPSVIEVGAHYLYFVPWSYGTAGIVMVVNAAFNGAGKPLPAVAISVGRMVAIYLPAAWLGAALAGAEGIFAAYALANVLSGLAAWLWFGHVLADPKARSATDTAPGTLAGGLRGQP